jgi:hypothetical protein
MRARILSAAAVLCCLVPTFSGAGRTKKNDVRDHTKYDLRYRPTVGERIAYQQSLDLNLAYTASAGGRHITLTDQFKSHLDVKCQEVLEVRDWTTTAAERVSFGHDCWTVTQSDDKPAVQQKLIYADKTVTFRLAEDGDVQQDFGVKPGRQEITLMAELMRGRSSFLPDHPVEIGECWERNESVRTLLDLSQKDTVSTVYTLKAMKQINGRPVALIGLSAAIIKSNRRGFSEEVTLQGTALVDAKTGLLLQCDYSGDDVAKTGPVRIRNVVVTIAGGGKIEKHIAARILPTADAKADAK